jgi:uncharacterized protein YkwD
MFRRALTVVLAGLMVACTAGEKPRTATQAPARPAAPASVSVNSLEQKVTQATNAFRDDNRLRPLKPAVQLTIVAQSHARNMARQDKFGDTDKNGHVLDGKGFEDRIKASGYAFAQVAENVGYQLNKPDPAAAMMEGWQDSPGHRRNILTPQATEIGVGAAQGKSGRWYFVQVFGRPQPPIKQSKLVR